MKRQQQDKAELLYLGSEKIKGFSSACKVRNGEEAVVIILPLAHHPSELAKHTGGLVTSCSTPCTQVYFCVQVAKAQDEQKYQ